MTTPLCLSLLDLATVHRGQTPGDALRESTELARVADRLGRFERLWFAEHHNMPAIASAATAVVIGHVLAATENLRVGSGGVMLPNHSPLVIAEQFGTLAELFPGRVDLGLGRAPGTDQRTLLALRRDARASDRFPQDVQELAGYLADESAVPGIRAVPGQGTGVPLYILGSSLFGAQLAAALGLPYAFASHFAPDALLPALAAYRDGHVTGGPDAGDGQILDATRPAGNGPYAIAALNVIVAETSEEAHALHEKVHRARVRSMASRGGRLVAEEDMDALLASPFAEQVRHMMTYTAVGDRDEVARYLADFAERTRADELMVTNAVPGLENRVRALEILATI